MSEFAAAAGPIVSSKKRTSWPLSDRYNNYADLAAGELEGVHYRVRVIERASPIVIVAPHGGRIEPGTSQTAALIAADEFSLYCFEGLVSGRRLHITSTLFDEASIKAIAIAPEEIPARWWKPQPPKLDQDGLTKAIRAREKALKEAELISDPDQRLRALAAIETLHPPIPGVTPSNGGITLLRRV